MNCKELDQGREKTRIITKEGDEFAIHLGEVISAEIGDYDQGDSAVAWVISNNLALSFIVEITWAGDLEELKEFDFSQVHLYQVDGGEDVQGIPIHNPETHPLFCGLFETINEKIEDAIREEWDEKSNYRDLEEARQEADESALNRSLDRERYVG